MENVFSSNISPVDALWALIQSQTKTVKEALYKKVLAAEEKRKTSQQEEFVRKSLTQAFTELNNAKGNLDQLPDARELFKMIDEK